MTPSIIYFPLMVTMSGSLKPGVPAELLEGLGKVNCRYLLRKAHNKLVLHCGFMHLGKSTIDTQNSLIDFRGALEAYHNRVHQT